MSKVGQLNKAAGLCSSVLTLSDLGHPELGVRARAADVRRQRVLHRCDKPPHCVWHLREPHPRKGCGV